jgi:formylglycine-generating enzyme required for sulfatase activity
MSERATESPLTVSVWHRPLVPEEAKDRLAKRQANAAVALLRLGREQKVWPLLQHRPDPRTRSYLLHRFGPLAVDPNQVLVQLDGQEEVSIRRALLLILGEFNEQQLPPSQRERLAPRLLDLYANDPDPGIHGAAAWTLRRWGRKTEIDRIDRELTTGKPEGLRRWYVNRQGQTLVIVPSPGEFVIGSPPWEAGREGGPEGDTEVQRHARIDHTFGVAIHPVTVAEFLRFRKDFVYRRFFAPEPDCPMTHVSWYECVAYCNWLNEQEGIPRDEWCYLPNEKGQYAEGMTIVADCLRRTGYRLPTAPEWEFACRAGTATSRYYGQSADLDNHYAWNMRLSRARRMALVGMFKPNDLGLFDMIGNAADWCHSVFHDGPRPLEDHRKNNAGWGEVLSDRSVRLMKGAPITHSSEAMRAAFFFTFVPNGRIYAVGFRVSRTYRREGDEPDAGWSGGEGGSPGAGRSGRFQLCGLCPMWLHTTGGERRCRLTFR